MVKALMIQGTGSNVGKSLIVAGLCRVLTRRGLRVVPFKPQNMSNNAAVTADGGEIGRAQALQARAAGVAPSVHMNPVLLKPESETGAQLIVQGQRVGHSAARDYFAQKPRLLGKALESFARVSAEADFVLIEGAGSPAETNLRAGDIANMGFACAAGVPVVLVGDIDRGGVIAQIVGTQAVLDKADLAQIAGFAINRFRGDPRLFDAGLADIKARTGWPSLGVIPWFNDAHLLPAEDILDLKSAPGGACRIVVPQLPRMSNFDDLDPLAAEPGVSLDVIAPGTALPGDADLVILPGSKSTIADLAFFRTQGWDVDLAAHVRRGGHVLGLCGGYQMLGDQLADPDGIEGAPQSVKGLGHLQVDTVMSAEKRLRLEDGATYGDGVALSGYEMHVGRTQGADCARPWITLADGSPHGAQSESGRVRGAYLHGLFASDPFRAQYLRELGARSEVSYDAQVERVLDALAQHLEAHLDINALMALAKTPAL